MRRAGNEPSKPLITVDKVGIKRGIAYMIANIVAVFIFPFWLLAQNFKEWVEERK